MLRYIISLIIFFHGLIHLIGFAKAFGYGNITQLSKEISKPVGALWFLTAFLFIMSAVQFFLKKDTWWIVCFPAVLFSQYLIITSWYDSRFGTIANVIILIAMIIGYGTWSFSNKFKNEVTSSMKDDAFIAESLLTENDIQSLPEPVKKYLHYTGSVNKPFVKNFKIEFTGQIRKNDKSEWMPFTSKQYNFINASTRLFFMNATMKNLPVAGFHCFKNGDAFMDIRLFSLFRVQYQSGKEMDVAETVTFFNDMCVMAPATLIDKRIKWLEADSNKVKAEFTNNNITITAWLYFNDKGELINFISDDRFAVAENNSMKRIPWSTPMKDYKTINGFNLAGYADAIYNYPEGNLCYGNFKLTNVKYNCKEFE
ncbi:MAG TPA: DUF6544 family protein [Bacteroidia bacterium]|nr:DUF6544 family protein [Bacteroidia bacterium]